MTPFLFLIQSYQMNYHSSSGSNPEWERLLPSVEEDINEEHLRMFFSMMYERQEIWYKRNILKQQPPWTENEWLRDYKFENVYRELDRNSQWEIRHIIMNDDLNPIDKLFQIIFFRLVNQPDFFEFYNREYNFFNVLPTRKEFSGEKFLKALKKYRETVGNPYTSAYLINTMCCGLGNKRDNCFSEKIIPHVRDNAIGLYTQLKKSKKPEDWVQMLETFPSVASFVSHEIYISLCYLERYSEKNWFPWNENDYTNVGPGASLGIRLIFPSTPAKEQKQRIYDLRDLAPMMLNKNFKYLRWDRKKGYSSMTMEKGYYVEEGREYCDINLHQIEFFTCAIQKYWKMINGVGKQRSRYNWNK